MAGGGGGKTGPQFEVHNQRALGVTREPGHKSQGTQENVALMTWSTWMIRMLLPKMTEKNSRPKGYGGSTLVEDLTSSHCNSSPSRYLLTVRNLVAEMNNTKGIQNSSIKADRLVGQTHPSFKTSLAFVFFPERWYPPWLPSLKSWQVFLPLAWAPHFQPAGELPGPMVKPCLSQILALATQS